MQDLSRLALTLSRLIPAADREAIFGDLLEDAAYRGEPAGGDVRDGSRVLQHPPRLRIRRLGDRAADIRSSVSV